MQQGPFQPIFRSLWSLHRLGRAASHYRPACARIDAHLDPCTSALSNVPPTGSPPCSYVDDKRRDREKREAVLKVLDEQVRQVQVRRLEEARLRQAEIAELQATWAKMAAEQEAAEAEEREAMRRLAAELQEFNRIKQMEISEAERQERWAGVDGAAAHMSCIR